mmetsp:Transcript_25946/g.56089  ORF Transcript_25946/g.56089 Transcript_25946/m.56089 type:complete len:478 (-) Transcript_25946:28-1461(-)
MMLFALPREVVFNFLSEWLSLNDLSLLDSALTERAARQCFRDMLGEEQFVLTQQHHGVVRDPAGLDFIFRRGVRVQAIEVHGGVDGYFNVPERAELFLQHLELRGQSLRFCESHWLLSGVLRGMVGARPALEELKTSFRLVDEEDEADGREGNPPFLGLVQALSGTLRRLTLKGTDYKQHSAASAAVMFAGAEHTLHELSIESVDDDAALAALCRCNNQLRKLQVTTVCNAGNEGLRAIAGCPLLQHLRIDSYGAVILFAEVDDVSPGMLALARGLSHLQCFEYKCDGLFPPAGLRALARHCPQLQEVSIANALQLDEGSIVELCRSAAGALRKLCLAGAALLGDSAVAAVALHCPHIEQLALRGMREATEEAYVLLKGCSKLKNLSLQVPITESGAGAIADNCPELEVLMFTGSAVCNDAAVRVLLAGCPKLRELNVSYGNGEGPALAALGVTEGVQALISERGISVGRAFLRGWF